MVDYLFSSSYIGGEYAESDDEVNVLRSEINNCFTQMEMLRREFIELREEVMAAKCLMDSVREMVIKLLSRI